MPNNTFLDALLLGARHSYDAIKQDVSDLAEGNITPHFLQNAGQVVAELPISKIAGRIGQAAEPLLGAIRSSRAAAKLAPAIAANPFQEALFDRIAAGMPIRRSALRPALRLPGGSVQIGDALGGHGSLYEKVPANILKQVEDGFVDQAGRFLTRDQGSILSGSLEGIQSALQNTFLK